MHDKIDWAKYYYKSLGRVDFTFFSRGVLSSFGHMEDTANIFVVNALICQNLIRSSCRRCMKAYFCVKKRTKGSFILSYISYSIKPFICYVEWYHINVSINDTFYQKCRNRSWSWMTKSDAWLFCFYKLFMATLIL